MYLQHESHVTPPETSLTGTKILDNLQKYGSQALEI